ncbi:MAG TPA: sulfatase [Macellibacteroides fermentans]|uniref:sulfatase family protein n=1 Tax=Macellibacteroides fermentans TaxID=879969 RepID=UPI002BDA55AF|nr:sulfatase [Macellibacteroides fermentans]
MNKNCFLSLLGCGLATFSAYPSNVKKQKADRPNIIFILSDDHARTAISAYGGINAQLAPTPNIDAIGHDGVIMRNMLCTNSISGPSRACLITGKYSTTHGFYQNEGGIAFDNSQQQYQKILRENGYTTSLFGKWHLYTEPAGFDYYKIHDNPGQQGTYWDPLYSTNGKKKREKGYATRLTADAALNWIDQLRDKSKPFCMMLHFKAPHRPWEPDSCYQNLYEDVEFPYPASFNDAFVGREKTLGENMASIENHLSRGDLKQIPPAGLTNAERNKWLWWGGSGKNQFWTPSDTLKGEALKKWKFQKYLKNYLRVVRSVDDQVGRLVKYLKEHNLYENTIIVYMGDQGFFLGEHGLYDKRWMYEEALQMPCLISYPKAVKKGQSLNKLALNIDIAPTLLDFAGVNIPKDIQGESLKPLLFKGDDGVKNWRKSAYYQYFEYPKWHNVQPHYGVRTERYKLIHFYYNVDVWELYDLKNDPNELNNVYNNTQYSSVVKSLKAEIDRLQKKYKDVQTLDERRKMTDKYMLKYEE